MQSTQKLRKKSRPCSRRKSSKANNNNLRLFHAFHPSRTTATSRRRRVKGGATKQTTLSNLQMLKILARLVPKKLKLRSSLTISQAFLLNLRTTPLI